MKNLIGIDELRPIVRRLNDKEITWGRATKEISEICRKTALHLPDVVVPKGTLCELEGCDYPAYGDLKMCKHHFINS